MAQGNSKFSLLLLFAICFFHCPHKVEQTTILKAGLIFERLLSSEILLNGKFLTLRRKVSVAPFFEAVQRLAFATRSFKSSCASAIKEIDKHQNSGDDDNLTKAPYVFARTKIATSRQAFDACENINGQLPAIRTAHDYEELRLFIRTASAAFIPANIYYDALSNSCL